MARGDTSQDAMEWMRRVKVATEVLRATPTQPVPIGLTPKTEMARIGKNRLYRYDPLPEVMPAGGPPLLVVHGLVGRHTIVDLRPGRSVVEDMLARGVDVWVVDWGNPGPEDRCLGLHDYINIFLGQMVARVREVSGQDRVSLFGICEGGLFCLMYACLHQARVRNLVLTITPVDCHADMGGQEGFLNLWLRGLGEDGIGALIDAHGNLPGAMMGAVFQAMTPGRALTKFGPDFVTAAQSEEQLERFMAMETWLADRPNHPGRMAKELLIGMYMRNALVKGQFEVDGNVIKMDKLHIPILNIYALRDHIVPPACAAGLGSVVGSKDYTELPLDAGHVGIFVSEKCHGVVAEAVVEWLRDRERPTGGG